MKVQDFNSYKYPKFNLIAGKICGYPYIIPFPNYKTSKTFV